MRVAEPLRPDREEEGRRTARDDHDGTGPAVFEQGRARLSPGRGDSGVGRRAGRRRRGPPGMGGGGLPHGRPAELVAVVDLGGGSCELAVGTRLSARHGCGRWMPGRSASRARFSTPSRLPRRASALARSSIRELLARFDPPRPGAALAVGGTARAIGRIVGRRFGVDELDELATALSRRRATRITEAHGITPQRAETLLGGTLVLEAIAERLAATSRSGAAVSARGRRSRLPRPARPQRRL